MRLIVFALMLSMGFTQCVSNAFGDKRFETKLKSGAKITVEGVKSQDRLIVVDQCKEILGKFLFCTIGKRG